jgi:phage N-6-adenine-methyltransferase
MSKTSDERYTPQHVLDVVRKFGPIVLDPCTTSDNPTGAAKFCTIDDDGLSQTWNDLAPPGSLIWVNPPYSRGMLRRWINACHAWGAFSDRHVMALIPSDLGSAAGQLAADTAYGLCFVRGRLKFGTPDGQCSAGAKQPSVIVYWGNHASKFSVVFAQLGVTWVR